MRLHSEPDWVVEEVATSSRAEAGYVQSVLQDLHHLTDRLVCDDVTVILAPLLFRRSGEPTFDAILNRFSEADWQDPWGLKALNRSELAREIDLSAETLELYPVAFPIDVFADLLAWRQVDWDSPEVDRLEDVFRAWRATFDAGPDEIDRRYRVSHVGLERDFETWLMGNLDSLAGAGYPVAEVRRQRRLGDAGIPDLVCRISEDSHPLRAGDWLVIENKATPVDLPAHEQLMRYVTALERELGDAEETVHGLLISDGTTVRLQQALLSDGLGFLSLTGLGYRDHLYRDQLLTDESDSDHTAADSVEPRRANVASAAHEDAMRGRALAGGGTTGPARRNP